MYVHVIHIPVKFKNIFLKKNDNITLVSYTNNKIIKLTVDKKYLQINSETNLLKICYQTPSIILKKSISTFNNLIFAYEDYFFQKIKFKGKGFRLKIKKRKKAIKFLFGHSHLNMIFLQNIRLKKSGKYKFFMKSGSKHYLNG